MSRSERWRINKSAIPVVEMANALKALSKVAGAKGISKDMEVRLTAIGSRVDFEKNVVSIKVADKLETCPIDPVAFDCMVGDTLHEAGHIVIDSRTVGNMMDSFAKSYGKDESKVALFVNIAEDVLVDTTLFNDPVTAEYSRASLDWYRARRPRGPDNYNLLEMWIEIALYRNGQALLDLPIELGAAMNALVELTRHIQHNRMYPAQRADEYRRVWEEIKNVVLTPPTPPIPEPPIQPNVPQKQEDEEDQEDSGKSGESEEDNPDGQTEEESKESKEDSDADSDNPESGEAEDGEPEEDGDSDTESKGDTEEGEGDKDDSESGDSGESEGEDGMDGEDGEGEESANGDDSGGDSDGDADSDTDSDSGSNEPTTPKRFDRPHDMGEPVKADFAQDVDAAIVRETEDATDEVNELLEEMGFASVDLPILRDRQKDTPFVQPDPYLTRQLETLVNVRKHLQNRTLRGEQSGKIDSRHLSRSQTNGRIFKQTWKFPLGLPKTDILLDMSGSMTERQVHDVLQAAGAMTSLFRSRVWGYRHVNSGIQLTRLDEEQRTRMMTGAGGTPSGLAILGLLQTCQRNGLIIHLTDGEHNTGINPNQIQKALEARHVEVVHVIWGRRPSGYSGIPHMKINGINEFPEALRTLLTAGLKLEF